MANITVKTIVDKFGLTVLSGQNKLSNLITMTGINRAGIELCGNIVYDKLIRIVLLGNKEFEFISKFSEKIRFERYQLIAKAMPPAIIITNNYKDDLLKQICIKYNIPLLLAAGMNSSEIIGTIGNFIAEALVAYKTIQGTLLEVYGEGVLITGKSGIGKSEIAMELIKKGHMFVGDDAIDIAKISGRLYAKSNPIVRNFIEIRGLGILNVSKMFGVQCIKKSAEVNLVIELVTVSENSYIDFERVGKDIQYMEMEGLKVPHYRFPVSPGRKISDLIESTVIDLKLRHEGYNFANEFQNNIEKNNKENDK